MARWKPCACTTFEISHFQSLHCYSKNPISSKSIQPIFEIFGSARRCWGRAFVWKDSSAQVFYFCNGKVKTLRMYNIWNYPLSICTLLQQKSYISRGIQPIFEILASARRCWGWAFGRKDWGAQLFYFCNGKVKSLPIYNIWNFPLSTCTLCLQKSYTSKGIPPIFEILASARRLWGWAFGWKVWSAQVFYFCNGKVKTLRLDNIWNLLLSTCKLCQQKSYISKRIQPNFEIFASARRCWGRAFGWKDSGAQLFYFYNGQVKTLRMYNIWNFPLSISTLSRQKSYIPKGIQPIFEIFASARKCWERAFGWKVSGAQVFYFCNGKVKTLRIYNIWNFPLSTCTLRLQKSYISKGIQPIFEIFASARRCWGWAFGRKDWGAQLFYFCNGKWKLCASTTFEILPLSTCTLCLQKSYISKGIPPIFEIFASARRPWGWAFGWKVLGA